MPIKFRKNIRLKEYNYDTNGYYFVTIVTHNRLPLLKLCKDAIEISIKKLPEFINGLDIDYFKIMDNHIHIIFIFKNCARPLGRVVSAMKYNITKIVKSGSSSQDNGECNSPATHAMHGTNDVAAGLPSSVNAANDKSPSTIWQWNYYEHIIRNEKSLRKIREYIDNNPLVENINWKDLDE